MDDSRPIPEISHDNVSLLCRIGIDPHAWGCPRNRDRTAGHASRHSLDGRLILCHGLNAGHGEGDTGEQREGCELLDQLTSPEERVVMLP